MRGTATGVIVIRALPRRPQGSHHCGSLAVALLVAVAGLALWPDTSLESVIRAVEAAASGMLATTVAVATAARQGLKGLREQVDQIRTDVAKNAEECAGQKLAAPLQALNEAEAPRGLALAQLVTVVARVAELGPGQRLYTFLADRVAAGDYARRLGFILTSRKDFDELIVLMRKWRDRLDNDQEAPNPIDRIVLYIDDLDRCSPRRVVEVLQAVHLHVRTLARAIELSCSTYRAAIPTHEE